MTRLLLLLILPLLAADEAVFKRLETIETEWTALTREAEGRVLRYQAINEAFPDSDSKGSLIREAAELHESLVRDLERGETLRAAHADLSRDLSSGAAARQLFGRKDTGAFRLIVYHERGDRMKRRGEELEEETRREYEAFESARAAYESERETNKSWLIAAAAFMAALAAGALAYWVVRVRKAKPSIADGTYTLLSLVGHGGMGVVYEAEDAQGRRVAVKRMRSELSDDPKELARVLDEARTVARLEHPNIVRIHAVVQEVKELYLVFEYVSGRTLEAILEEKGRLGWDEAVGILDQMASAVDHAHSGRVIHRDLKPSNVMVDERGAVKVMDFGIAYQVQESITRLTKAPVCGSPQYMAPEQELGGFSKASDVFALGVCFYQMLTGELPFKGPNFLLQKKEEFYPSASTLVAGLPAGIDLFFKKALAADRASRFQTGAELTAAARALRS